MADNALDAVFEALAAGDVAGAQEWLAQDCEVQHCFDEAPLNRERAAIDWQAFVDAFPSRSFSKIRTQQTTTGLVRQHVMTTCDKAGQQRSWEVCIVVRLEGHRIKRLDEYLDRAGSFKSSE